TASPAPRRRPPRSTPFPYTTLFRSEAFRQALLAAGSVAYTNPAAGGSSGTFFAGLLEKLGIADAVNAKVVFGNRGYEVAQAVARSEEHTSELQSRENLVCRLLLEKK